MPSRRAFLGSVAAGLSAAAGSVSAAPQPREIETRLKRPVGLQLYSLRADLPKNLRGTLAKVRAMGFREVEGAGLWGNTATGLRAALDEAGLRCQSAHMGFERLRDDWQGAVAEAKALGATWVVCPWIPHEGAFTREDAARSADAFTGFAKAAGEAGLRFAYHCHGYEFVPSAEGTLFDTLAGATSESVSFQVDVFHAFLGGADPAALITRYKTRVTSLHLKDLRKGFPVKAGTAVAPAEADVPLGTGQLDMPAVLGAAMGAATERYYIEDESADPLEHIPRSVAYLSAFKA